MKQFETKLTVRIYDIKLVERLNELYRRNPNKYQSKNQLLVELLEKGMSEKLKEITPPPNAPAGAMKMGVPETDTVTLLREVKELIADMHEYDKKHIEGLLAHLKMSERLSASIYNMLLAIATDEPITPMQMQLGYFDDVPPRFIDFLAELLKEVMAEVDEGDDDEDIDDEGGDDDVRLAS